MGFNIPGNGPLSQREIRKVILRGSPVRRLRAVPMLAMLTGIERRCSDQVQDTDSHAILEALDKTARNKAKTARFPGMDRVTLYRRMKRYNLAKDIP
jgi:transcriptional regulator of acetoin/glycerol metabolism